MPRVFTESREVLAICTLILAQLDAQYTIYTVSLIHHDMTLCI